MTSRAAGTMITTGRKGRTLFVRRADGSDHQSEWAFPGGNVEDGETVETAAHREADEEIGPQRLGKLLQHTRRIAEDVDYTTFISVVKDEFIPTLNDEHDSWTWASLDDPPEPLHPGAKIAVDRLSMDELAIARAMAAEDLVGPIQYGNLWLYAIRITGTGLAYRSGRQEYVWRDSSLYLTDEFLARCNGLPVVWEHPDEKPSLDSAEFNKRIVGTVFVPFIKGEDVWAIVKVWDGPTIKALNSEILSTSPGVVFREATSTNETFKMKDGSTLLIEGKPALLDHIALCEAGVWDKGGAPSGVDATGITMAEDHEDKAAADKARHDAEMSKLDAIMDAFKRMDSRLDSFEKEKKDSARKDAARKDKFGHRKDGEKFHDWSKRHDADEAAMADAMRKDGADEKDCMDAAKDARKDAEEEEKRHDKDFEKWAKEEEKEPEHKEDKDSKKDSKKDAEEPADKEKEEKEKKAQEEREDSRKDSVDKENADLRLRLARLEGAFKGIVAETSTAERDSLAATQGRADSVAAMFGDRAAPPLPGETALDYRRRQLTRFQRHSPRFKDSRFDALDSATLSVVEDQVYADAASSSRVTADTTVGMLVPYEERDRSGRMITRYRGDIGAFLQPFVPAHPTVGKINRNPKGMN